MFQETWECHRLWRCKPAASCHDACVLFICTCNGHDPRFSFYLYLYLQSFLASAIMFTFNLHAGFSLSLPVFEGFFSVLHCGFTSCVSFFCHCLPVTFHSFVCSSLGVLVSFSCFSSTSCAYCWLLFCLLLFKSCSFFFVFSRLFPRASGILDLASPARRIQKTFKFILKLKLNAWSLWI